jgi:hypothetical protein
LPTAEMLFAHGDTTTSGEDIAILRPEKIRLIQERRALVIAENGKRLSSGSPAASTEEQAAG